MSGSLDIQLSWNLGDLMEHMVSFPSKGYTLAGRLHLPSEGIFPGVVVYHGFKDHKDKPFYVDLAQTLERSGFAVLRFDFAGSGESDWVVRRYLHRAENC